MLADQNSSRLCYNLGNCIHTREVVVGLSTHKQCKQCNASIQDLLHAAIMLIIDDQVNQLDYAGARV